MKYIDNVCAGMVVDHLTVLRYAGRDGWGSILFDVECDCGKRYTTRKNNLTSKPESYKSCGCVRIKRVVSANTRHGMSHSDEYRAFVSARQRCENPKHRAYQYYGGRGIRFCFSTFEQWFAELGPRPSKSHTVDRKNNSGHYEPGNVRWATYAEQNVNRRSPEQVRRERWKAA